MKLYTYYPIENSGKLSKTDCVIDVKRGRWVVNETNHPMEFDRVHAFENKYVYFLHHFGINSGIIVQGDHIVLNFWQNHKFLFMQRAHWIQNNNNLKWILGMLVSALVGYLLKTMTC